MELLEKIKRAFGKKAIIEKDGIDRLTRLPKDQAQKEFATIAYDLCVKRAAEFVKGELQRADSPYQGLSPAIFFHEILTVTFWLLSQQVGGDQSFMQEVHDIYFRSHVSPDMSIEERRKALAGKYVQYEDFWNEITGHLDEFALLVVRNMYGSGESVKTRERSFWIIQYADETASVFSPLKKIWKKIFSPSK